MRRRNPQKSQPHLCGGCTCPVGDVDGDAGCGAVSSAGDGVHSDGVVSARLKAVDDGGGLGAGNGELLWIALTSCIDGHPRYYSE